MRKQSVEKQVSEELTSYFEQARQVKCPPSMKQNLYARIGLEKSYQWLKPAMAFSFVALASVGLVWHHQHQQLQMEQAEREMQIAMHYMQKISVKALEDTNTLGIKPGIIVPVSKSMAQI